ncbi:hypothetical protein EYF80_005106 [Liparis tanakae]|uniref:Uncharacterized protein n=1 Tax=Liparis tanakae TaxID=230148 RepID=A0A4Z2J432_9TELE|nr:hypothetical protein EYF80_005106 [Liparis tanakae]
MESPKLATQPGEVKQTEGLGRTARKGAGNTIKILSQTQGPVTGTGALGSAGALAAVHQGLAPIVDFSNKRQSTDYEAAVIVPHRSQGPRGGGPPYSHAPRHRVMRSARPQRLTLKAQGKHTLAHREAGEHKRMHKGERAHAQSARHVECTCEHAHRQINTKAGQRVICALKSRRHRGNGDNGLSVWALVLSREGTSSLPTQASLSALLLTTSICLALLVLSRRAPACAAGRTRGLRPAIKAFVPMINSNG